ncbi:MAG: hypothetical protein AAF583_06460, partial [Pseudomonadota bacterium]
MLSTDLFCSAVNNSGSLSIKRDRYGACRLATNRASTGVSAIFDGIDLIYVAGEELRKVPDGDAIRYH